MERAIRLRLGEGCCLAGRVCKRASDGGACVNDEEALVVSCVAWCLRRLLLLLSPRRRETHRSAHVRGGAKESAKRGRGARAGPFERCSCYSRAAAQAQRERPSARLSVLRNQVSFRWA